MIKLNKKMNMKDIQMLIKNPKNSIKTSNTMIHLNIKPMTNIST